MRLNSKARLVWFAPLLLLSLALSRSADMVASRSPSADVRYFQMALFTYEFMEGGVNWLNVAEYADIPMFEGYSDASHQPAGRSIMRLPTWQQDRPLASVNVDWSRVLAVVIDEPFATIVADFKEPSAGGAECTDQNNGIAAARSKLMAAAAAVHHAAPRTRFWVNYSGKEVQVMRRDQCPLALNDATIDVVSLDIYQEDFDDAIKDHYDWFMSQREQQQIALVPATHYKVGIDSDSKAARRLEGFFEYANSLNQRCERPLGRVGRTGNYDGCPVWVVAGWLAQPVYEEASVVHHGMLNESSFEIRNAWSSQFFKGRRFGGRDFLGDELGARTQLRDD
jgi:hypothetical protein